MDLKLNRIAAAFFLGSSLLFSGSLIAADPKVKPAETQTDPKVTKAPGAKPEATATGAAIKLVKPWSEVASLSDEQKVKIKSIHEKSLSEINVIEKKEKEEIMALLSDAQKSELKEATSKKKKEAAAAKLPEKTPEAK